MSKIYRTYVIMPYMRIVVSGIFIVNIAYNADITFGVLALCLIHIMFTPRPSVTDFTTVGHIATLHP